MELSPTAYVILGMVRHSPKCGYEIKAAVDDSTRFFWAASYGQIYPELRRLAEAGLVEGRSEPRGERKRTVFSITKAGERALQEWLRIPPSTFETRDEGLLKLFFADALPREEAIATLRAMRAHRLGVVERLRSLEPKARAASEFTLMVLQGGIEHNQRWAEWCERMERRLEAEPAQERKGA